MSQLRTSGLFVLLAACVLLAGCGDDETYDPTGLGVQRYGAPKDQGDKDAGPAIVIGKAEDTTKKPPPPKADGGSPGAAPVRPPPPKKAPSGRYSEVEVEGGGTIRGMVKFASKPPARWTIDFNKDQKACGHDHQETQRVIYDPNTLGIANCVVYLADISKGKAWTGEMAKGEDVREAVLDQKACTYEPHILTLRTSTLVKIKNSDPAQHNVNVIGVSNNLSPSNSTMEGPYIERAGMYDVKCDIHSWMNGHLFVSPHPYFVVTGPDGKFELKDVPPGEYTLVVWHEGMGEIPQFGAGGITGYDYGEPVEQSRQVTVTADGETAADFQIQPPVAPKGG